MSKDPEAISSKSTVTIGFALATFGAVFQVWREISDLRREFEVHVAQESTRIERLVDEQAAHRGLSDRILALERRGE